MSNRALGFGIVGCGMIARFHARAIRAIPGARLVGATDTVAASRDAFCSSFGIECFADIDALCASPSVDVVCVCLPSGLHAACAITAARAGRHVVIEKPMAITLRQADEVIAACEKSGVTMAVISQMRFAPGIRALRRAISEGVLGRLLTGDVFMKYHRSPEYYATSSWKGTWDMDGGGALMNQGIHGIDLLRHLMGPVRSVYGYARTLALAIEVEDTACAVLEYENGALGVIQGTTSVLPGSPRRLEVSGTKGTIVMEEDALLRWDVPGVEPPPDVVIGHAATTSTQNPGDMDVEGHIRQISDLIEAISEHRRPLVDCYEGRNAVELVCAIYESSRTGKPVRLGG